MLAHQKASAIKAGDQIFYKFRRYEVTEATGDYGGVLTRLIGRSEDRSLHILVLSDRKFWTLKKREHHDPLHGLRERPVPVRRRLELPGVSGHQHLPVLSRHHVVGEVARRETVVGPGVLAVRTLIGPRVRTPFHGQAPQVPYVLSVAGSSLVQALHTGRRPGFGADWGSETLGERSMVPDLCAAIPHPQGRQTLGRDWPAAGTIRIVIPSGLQERDDQGIQAR